MLLSYKLLVKEKESNFALKLVISMWKKKKKGQTNMNIEICGKGNLKRILCVIIFNLMNEF